MKIKKQPLKSAKKPTAKRRVKFTFKRRYERGYHYAFKIGRCKKKEGVYVSHNKRFVKLYVHDVMGKLIEYVKVPHAAIIKDPWATVGQIPRERSPKCVLFVRPTNILPRYARYGQSPMKGERFNVRASTAI